MMPDGRTAKANCTPWCWRCGVEQATECGNGLGLEHGVFTTNSVDTHVGCLHGITCRMQMSRPMVLSATWDGGACKHSGSLFARLLAIPLRKRLGRLESWRKFGKNGREN